MRPASTAPVLIAGELNVDLVFGACGALPEAGREVLAGSFAMVPGSSSMICAMGLARLGREVIFVGRTGADAWGDYCVDALAAAGVDVAAVRRDPTLRTGVTASLSTRADRALVTYPGAIGSLRGEDVDEPLLRRAGHLHVASYYLQSGLRADAPALFARARAAGLSTSLDPGFDPAGRWDGAELRALLALVDVFLPNEVELAAIAGIDEPLAALRALDNGRTLTVAKRGARGSAALVAGRLLEAPGFPVNAVDSTGAGDSFDAGFLHAWLRGEAVEACLRWANACGALSTRGVGGTAAQPGAADVLALLEAAQT